jgi:hypothetical protein
MEVVAPNECEQKRHELEWTDADEDVSDGEIPDLVSEKDVCLCSSGCTHMKSLTETLKAFTLATKECSVNKIRVGAMEKPMVLQNLLLNAKRYKQFADITLSLMDVQGQETDSEMTLVMQDVQATVAHIQGMHLHMMELSAARLAGMV